MPTRERLLALIDILLRQTDEEHPISGVKLAKELNKLGIAAEKRAIYADIAALNKAEWNIKLNERGYYANRHAFTTDEARLISYAVDAAGFIDHKTAESIKAKLASTQNSYYKAPAAIPKRHDGETKSQTALLTIAKAIEEKKQLSCLNNDEEEATWARTRLDPISIETGGGRLYLSCMCGNEQKLMPIDELTGLRIERQAIRR